MLNHLQLSLYISFSVKNYKHFYSVWVQSFLKSVICQVKLRITINLKIISQQTSVIWGIIHVHTTSVSNSDVT